VFAWGEAEGLAITDILATADVREYGQAELRELREPIPAVFYSMPIANSKLSLVGTWKAGHHRYAETDEEFYPFMTLKTFGLVPISTRPEKEWEAAIKLEQTFNGSDISFVLADINDNEWTVVPPTPAFPTRIDLQQARVRVAAGSANRVMGSWQIKSELGLHRDKLSLQMDGQLHKHDQWRAMLGAEYSGINNWLFSVEIDAAHNEMKSAVENEGELGVVAHLQQQAFNERLTQHLWFFNLLEDNGQIGRWDLEYEWRDNWAFALAVVIYRNDAAISQLYPFRHNDSFNASVTMHF
jgi:hypothetical protein